MIAVANPCTPLKNQKDVYMNRQNILNSIEDKKFFEDLNMMQKDIQVGS